jgi:DNA repair exonuclease SbcCD ATPase subunit
MTKRPTSRDTKADILNQYDQLFDEQKKLLSQLEQLKKDKESLEKKVPKEMEIAKPEKKQIEEKMKEKEIAPPRVATMDQIVEGLQSIRSGFGKAVNELSAQLVAEASTLAALQDRITDETNQLQLLYDLEVTNEMLGQLINEYTEKSTAFEQEAQQKQQAFEFEMLEKNKTWQKEQEEYNRTIKEQKEIAELNFKREEIEYRYHLEQQRKLDNEDFEIKLKKLQRELDSFEANKKKEWHEREKIIAEQENEFEALKQRVEKYPEELETSIKNTKAKASQVVQREAQIKTDLWAKEVEGEKRVYEARIKSLEEILKNQVQQIQALSAKLDATLKQSQALAMKAIEGASSVSSFQSVKEIAMEQAKKVKSE